MRKLFAVITTLSIFALFCAPSYADTYFEVHGQGGFELDTMNGNYWSFQAGGGVALYYSLGKTLGIQPELNISYNWLNEAKAQYRYASIDIPVLLTARFWRLNFLLGPNLSIPCFLYEKNDGYRYRYQMILGITGGVNYEHPIGLMNLILGVRYLQDIFVTNDNYNRDLFMRGSFLFNVGMAFPLV